MREKVSQATRPGPNDRPDTNLLRRSATRGVRTLTPTLSAERLDRLHELIPEAFSEGTIDPGALLGALGHPAPHDERYEFTWVGKQDAVSLAHLPSVGTLGPDEGNSVDYLGTRNVFIEGENLEVVKLLYTAYYGRIRLIYLDPPYNTKKDFIYADNYVDPLKAYLEKTGQKADGGTLLTSNPETSGRYHSAWLSMMYPAPPTRPAAASR